LLDFIAHNITIHNMDHSQTSSYFI